MDTKPITEEKQSIKSKSRHDELKIKIATIGSWLGFEIETEKSIATGAVIDTVWKAKISNLGQITYVFEVQDRGSIDSLILNLQRAQSNSIVQKLVVVTDKDQIEKIKNEILTMPEHFRKAITYWEDRDVDETYENLEQVTNSITRLNLLNDVS